ncbi:hypothetical protein EBOKLHFM_00020 [Klebsiella phage KP13-26]|nr:hypothetical protein EBOKLHFM_00020 [Klebsiella phage KP13-26]
MNNILIEKRAELLEVKQAIYAKQREIRNFSYESTDDEYDSYLDGCYGDLDVCGSTFSASYALKNLDPTAYRCGKSDYDSEKDLDDVPEYVTLMEELEELEDKETDLENEIEELEVSEE